MTARVASGLPSRVTGVWRRMVPMRRSVKISSRYSAAGSILISADRGS